MKYLNLLIFLHSSFLTQILILKTSFNSFLHIGKDALNSLQIFDQEAHANLHSNKTKEGLSVYGILNECVTYSGRMLLRYWLIRPSTQLTVIAARADLVECFLSSENGESNRMRKFWKLVHKYKNSIMSLNHREILSVTTIIRGSRWKHASTTQANRQHSSNDYDHLQWER